MTFTGFRSGDNFFKTASYTIEALCAKTYEDTTAKLKDIEAQILRKRTELRQFETEYRKVLLVVFLLNVTVKREKGESLILLYSRKN